MKINDSSDIIMFDNVPISRKEQLMFNAPHSMKYATNNIVFIDGKYYYAKVCTTNALINELIGSCFSSLLELDAVDYKIGIDKKNPNLLYALSEVFYQEDYDYYTVDNYYGMRPDDSKIYSKGIEKYYICDTSILDYIDSPILTNSVLKMTVVDIKMGQVDRYDHNVLIKRINDSFELGKVYDFGASYLEDGYSLYNCYYNPFLLIKRNTISLWGLAYKYPQINESAAILSTTPLYDVLKNIESRFNIKVENKDIQGYMEADDKLSKILKKIK